MKVSGKKVAAVYRPVRVGSGYYFFLSIWKSVTMERDRNDGGLRHEGRPNDKNDRNWWNRAGDEMLSWMGDDYATRRRRHDDESHAGKGPKNYRRSDDRIRDDVVDRLTDEWNVDATDIEVNVVNSEVILSGFVLDRYQKRRAEEVAETVRGVTHVENRLRVQPYTSKDNVNLVP
jgi:osmotically-inducible protein OsmY